MLISAFFRALRLGLTWRGLMSFAWLIAGWPLLAVSGAPPNVVVLVTDDQGTLDLRCAGAEHLHTPHLDRLAGTGVRFTQAYAHTVCCPSRAALLTGRHPQRSGINTWTQSNRHGRDGLNLPLAEVTLAEVLRTAGYRTGLFGKWHLGAHREHGPDRQGFDTFFGILGGFIDNYRHTALHGDGFHDLYDGSEEIWADGEYFPELMLGRALRFIEENQDTPFFLQVSFNLPHYPEQALPEHLERYADLPEPRRSYAAAVTTVDEHIGRILAKLEALDLRRNTVIVFQSDNGHSEEVYRIASDDHISGHPRGFAYGTGGGGGFTGKWIGCKGRFLEGGVRTPALLSYPPRVPQGAIREQVVTIMDWFPTILALCGIEPPPVELDGRNLLPVIDDAAAPSPHAVLHFQWQDHWAVRENDWKLIHTRSSPQSPADERLVNLSDPAPEQTNHLADRPDVAERLRRLREQFLAATAQ